MPFAAPPYGCDVFVSYAHAKRGGRNISTLQQWSRRLTEKIRDNVSYHSGFEEVELFDDSMRDNSDTPEAELETKVRSSALLLVIMSEPYLSSDWCMRELRWFQEGMGGQPTNRLDMSRVVLARAMRTDETQWPELLRLPVKPQGFDFVSGDLPYADCWDGEPATHHYSRQAQELSEAIVARLRKFKPPPPAPSSSGVIVPGPPANGHVYLYSRPSPSYQALSLQVSATLAAAGIRNFRSPAPAASGDPTEEAALRVTAACGCRAMVLVRADDSSDFFVDLIYIGVMERQLIEAKRRGPPFCNEEQLLCAVLDSSGSALPRGIDMSGTGISHFDMRNPNWQGHFRSWLDGR